MKRHFKCIALAAAALGVFATGAANAQSAGSWLVRVGADFSKTFLKTRAALSTGQTLDATLNPTAVGLSVGYRF